jgi:hypothetical protein
MPADITRTRAGRDHERHEMLLARMANSRAGRPCPLCQIEVPFGDGSIAQDLRQPAIERLRRRPGTGVAERREIVKTQAASNDEDIIVAQAGERPADLDMPTGVQTGLQRQLQYGDVGIRKTDLERNKDAVILAAVAFFPSVDPRRGQQIAHSRCQFRCPGRGIAQPIGVRRKIRVIEQQAGFA